MIIDLTNVFYRADDDGDDDDGDDDESKKNPNSEIARSICQVMYCLQPAVRSDITAFNLNSDSNLSETIFRSICQCEFLHSKYFI